MSAAQRSAMVCTIISAELGNRLSTQQHLTRAQAEVSFPTLCDRRRTVHQGKGCQMSGDDHPTERANNTKLDPEEDAQQKVCSIDCRAVP